jgi:hypothetical protein
MIRAGIAKFTGGYAAVGLAVVKAVFMTSAISQVKDLDMPWYFEEMLPGLVTANGVRLDTMEEIAETGIGPIDLLELMWVAMVVNFRPTSTARAMFDGSAGAVQSPENRTNGKSSYRGGATKDGQAAPIQ